MRGKFSHCLIGRVGQLKKVPQKFWGLPVALACPQILRRLGQRGLLGEDLDEPIPGIPHADEIDCQPAIFVLGAARAGRVVAQLQKQLQCLVEAFDLFLKIRELRPFLRLLGLHEKGLDLSADLVELLGEANLPGRDVAQPAAVFAQQRHAENLGPQRFIVGQKKRHVVPFLRLDGPGVEEFGGQESPRLALACQTLDLVRGKRTHFGIRLGTEFPQAGADVAAEWS